MMTPLPLPLGRLDHYTLIVPDAAACSRFHMEVLGFGWVREQKVNAGSAPEGEYDMLNHVLHLPGDPSRTMVVTEGLTEDSIFRKYLDAHGPGIHHVAYAVDDLAEAYRKLEEAEIPLTSKRIAHDPMTGLRQAFISRDKTGYFIELIERTEEAEEGVFKSGNMAELAKSMKSYIGEGEKAEPSVAATAAPTAVVGKLPCAIDEAKSFLSEPGNLPLWTAHQTVMKDSGGGWIERRMNGDVPLEVKVAANRVSFGWEFTEKPFEVHFDLDETPEGVRVTVPIPQGVDEARAVRTANAIKSELVLLSDALGASVEPKRLEEARQEMGRFHLEVYSRKGA